MTKVRTRTILLAMDNETKQALEAMEDRIMKRFDELEERIKAALARLLFAFHES